MPTTIVLTNTGKATAIHRLAGTPGYEAPKYVGWGTGAGNAAENNTSLFTEASEARVPGAASVITDTVPDDTYEVVGTLEAEGTKTITNAGTFDNANKTTYKLFMKASFDGIPVEAGDSIQLRFRYIQEG